MIKTITIGDVEVRMSNNIGWAMAYRSQFGHDIMPTIIPLVASVVDLVKGFLSASDDGEITVSQMLDLTEDESFYNALIHLSGFEVVDLINITWSLCKCADKSIDPPEVWIEQFEVFPVDELVPIVFELITSGIVSSKNLERLKSLREKVSLQPLNSTK